MKEDILVYNQSQTDPDRVICEALGRQIAAILPKAESKVWHGHPVWFIDGNPIVGYAKLKNRVQLLFWSGQSFDEPALKPEGTFKAAEANYTSVDEIDIEDLERWLTIAQTIQWDYKNIVKRRGELIRIN